MVPSATSSESSSVASRIFISYAREDEVIARELHSQLSESGLKPWLDLFNLSPGDSIVGGVTHGLENASYVVMLNSKASLASRWVDREWKAAFTKSGTVIIPVLLDDSEVPLLLRDVVHIDLRSDQPAQRRKEFERLVRFFAMELRVPAKMTLRSSGSGESLASASRRQLRLIAMRCLDDSALQAFCFDTEIDPGSLSGSSVHERVLSLLHRTGRDGLMSEFAEWLEHERSRCVQATKAELKDTPMWNFGSAEN